MDMPATPSEAMKEWLQQRTGGRRGHCLLDLAVDVRGAMRSVQSINATEDSLPSLKALGKWTCEEESLFIEGDLTDSFYLQESVLALPLVLSIDRLLSDMVGEVCGAFVRTWGAWLSAPP